MLENAWHHDLLLLALDVLEDAGLICIINTLADLRGLIKEEPSISSSLNIRISLQNLVDPLLHHTHVDKHIALSNALVTEQILVLGLVGVDDF